MGQLTATTTLVKLDINESSLANFSNGIWDVLCGKK